MKKESALRKLTLNRETIQSLDPAQLEAVAGGAPTVVTSCTVPRTCTC